MSVKKLLAVFLILAAAIGGYFYYETQGPAALVVQGEVEATRIDLAGKVSGRVAEVNADFGDRVVAGDVLVVLNSPQLEASLASAQAAQRVAVANRDLIFATRPETIDARAAEFERAKADLVLAEKVYERIRQLTEHSTASIQRLDEASNTLSAAKQNVLATEANLRLAQNGNSVEQKAAAEAQVLQADASVSRTKTDIAELTIYAPINGQVTARLAEPGELFSSGAILMSIVDIDNAWFTFNLREDLLNGLTVGQELDVQIPALNNRVIPAKVTAVNAEGNYANWRATKATGDFDLRTFSIRLEPIERDLELRPGMSALIAWKRR
ncbi:efflux RND transporter periplasmic adaptor subunit [Shimia sp. R9_1]|uniref:HlyD family secretion protein n=1 Tax=Shimia sp. R9_1 TaxID=2821111 RepID=UPI001ADB6C8F|nr:efflux RND transporter periplasmic adaptor subunit [Shimia sp. R9_1]MBO9406674.1 efflux RND transporter periplasmic adaptor subunit [Shimia sp. R9_1]